MNDYDSGYRNGYFAGHSDALNEAFLILLNKRKTFKEIDDLIKRERSDKIQVQSSYSSILQGEERTCSDKEHKNR